MHNISRFIVVATAALASIATPVTGEAASLDDASSAYNHGDRLAALRIWEPLAGQGNAIAELFVGSMWADLRHAAPDFDRATWFFHEGSCEKERASVEYISTNGRSGVINYTDTIEWLHKAADAGDPLAQFVLGHMYENGIVVKRDDPEAIKWLRSAAEQGQGDASYDLWSIYEYGAQSVRDHSEAIKWLRNAAERGDPRAQYTLGGLFERGNLGAPNFAEALKWWRKAADQGNHDAQRSIAQMYDTAQKLEGVPKNDVEAVRWYRLAADHGDMESLFFLGYAYELGAGVVEDDVQALAWFDLYTERRPVSDSFDCSTPLDFQFPADTKPRDTLAKRLTPDQVAAAQRLADGWKPATQRFPSR